MIDASFIGLSLVLPATKRLLKPQAQIVALVKPQFEAGREHVGKGGVVRAEETHRRVLTTTLSLAESLGMMINGLTVSPAPGPAGNIEFLLWLECHQTESLAHSTGEPNKFAKRKQELIEAVLKKAEILRHGNANASSQN